MVRRDRATPTPARARKEISGQSHSQPVGGARIPEARRHPPPLPDRDKFSKRTQSLDPKAQQAQNQPLPELLAPPRAGDRGASIRSWPPPPIQVVLYWMRVIYLSDYIKVDMRCMVNSGAIKIGGSGRNTPLLVDSGVPPCAPPKVNFQLQLVDCFNLRYCVPIQTRGPIWSLLLLPSSAICLCKFRVWLTIMSSPWSC